MTFTLPIALIFGILLVLIIGNINKNTNQYLNFSCFPCGGIHAQIATMIFKPLLYLWLISIWFVANNCKINRSTKSIIADTVDYLQIFYELEVFAYKSRRLSLRLQWCKKYAQQFLGRPFVFNNFELVFTSSNTRSIILKPPNILHSNHISTDLRFSFVRSAVSISHHITNVIMFYSYKWRKLALFIQQ